MCVTINFNELTNTFALYLTISINYVCMYVCIHKSLLKKKKKTVIFLYSIC